MLSSQEVLKLSEKEPKVLYLNIVGKLSGGPTNDSLKASSGGSGS